MDMENQVADNEMAMEALRWFVSDFYQNKLEADRECEEAISEVKDFKSGRRLAYFEVWDMFGSRRVILNISIDLPKEQ